MVHAGRHWSISDRPRSQSRPRTQLSKISSPPRNNGPSKSDIARIRALLMCSGIKAQEIARRAHTARASGPSEFLQKAAETGAQDLEPNIPKKEEHVVAARILVTQLEKETSTLHGATEHFRADKTAALFQRLSDLRHKLEGKAADLKDHPDTVADAPQFHASSTTGPSDDNHDGDNNNAAEDPAIARERGGLMAFTHAHSIMADTLVKDVTTSYTLEIQRLNGSIEQMVRTRRRHGRWLRRMGFWALEWLVLWVMWIVWFVVVVMKGVLGVGRAVGGAVRWVVGL